jgi:UDPglucose 6-dehydrogenase
MRVAVIGTGYVGLVSGACLADLGHTVVCVDVNEEKINKLREGIVPIFEPGLEEVLQRNVKAGRLAFTTRYDEAIPGAEVISIAVNTPSAEDGSADMSAFFTAAEKVATSLTGYAVIANKSTVTVGTAEAMETRMKEIYKGEFDVISNPEFLREGHAVYDFLHPPRVIIGSDSRRATDVMVHLYGYLDCPKIIMDRRSAELTKYAANAFLATKISFINEIAHLADTVGADVEQIAKGIGTDPRIGKDFLKAGLGWGGSCFPKDVRALLFLGHQYDQPLPVTHAAQEMNQMTRSRVVERLERHIGDLSGRTVAILGLSFKGNTDDTRESAAIDLILGLLARNARVVGYDPKARLTPTSLHGHELPHATDPYEAATGADAVFIATDWEEFRALDLQKLASVMKEKNLFDARNLLDPALAREHGFTYFGVGRGR